MKRTLLLIAVFAGCKGTTATDGGAGDAPPQTFGNVVDAVIVPMLAQHGLTAIPEDPAILCRRMAIDLTGIAPTPAEQANQCKGAPRDVATYFMNKTSAPNLPTMAVDNAGQPIAADPTTPYVWVNRRWWADRFQYQAGTNPASTFYVYVRDLDQIVSDLYSGKIGYDVFAERALASPGFARRFGIFDANHDLVQLASQAYRVFLGREALPSEAEDFGNLWRGWNAVYMNEMQAEPLYPDCPITYDQQMNRIGCRHSELGLQGSQCAGASEVGCESTILGAGAVVPSANGFVRWANLSATDLAALQVPGKLMVAQPEFADAAVDMALAKYLGWWKAGFFRPDFDVPAVRDALVKKLVADKYDVRKLEMEIVSSVLYTQAARLQPNQLPTDPIWAFGPTKLLWAEAWLDTVGQALGKQVGGCDFRYTGTGQNRIDGFYVWPVGSGVSKAFYFTNAQNMGGCPVAAPHADASGLVPAVTKRVVLSQLCPGAFKPTGTTLESLLNQEFAGVGRAPTDGEAKTLLAHMGDPADGGCDPNNLGKCQWQPLADSLCTSLFATAQFNYY